MKITSRDNQRIKFARKVSSGRVKEAIFVEGARLAEEVLRAELEIFDVLFTENFRTSKRGQNILQIVEAKTDNLAEVPEQIFNAIADTKHSQGIVIIAAKPSTGKKLIEV